MDPNEDDEQNTASATSPKKDLGYPGPLPGVHYPLTVIYCGGKLHEYKLTIKYLVLNIKLIVFQECNLPTDLCENSANPEACKEWLEKNHPDFYTKMNNLQSNLK